MPRNQVHTTVTRIFGARAKTKLPSGVLPLWEDPDKMAILAGMSKFS